MNAGGSPSRDWSSSRSVSNGLAKSGSGSSNRVACSTPQSTPAASRDPTSRKIGLVQRYADGGQYQVSTGRSSERRRAEVPRAAATNSRKLVSRAVDKLQLPRRKLNRGGGFGAGNVRTRPRRSSTSLQMPGTVGENRATMS